MTTPHITAEPGAIAPHVLMPGDPYRAARIAKDFLTDAQIVSDVRGIQCHTGTWNGHAVSVMASGMGIPTISIYATELFRFYDVQRIIRVGTAGGLSPDVTVRDVLVATAAHTNSSVATFPALGAHLSLTPSFPLLRAAGKAVDAYQGSAKIHFGPILSSDFFYINREDTGKALDDVGTLGVEMEAAGLYYCAMRERKEALAILTVSDHLKDDRQNMAAQERETSYQTMVELALTTITD